jgi:poly-gamma-glutamate synthesis protein (capsule biosynthesis protein)
VKLKKNKFKAILHRMFSLTILGIIAACTEGQEVSLSKNALPTDTATVTNTSVPSITPTATALPPIKVWIDPDLPWKVLQQTVIPASLQLTSNSEDADIQLTNTTDMQNSSIWVYALVTPFPSLVEMQSFEELQQTWNGTNDNSLFIYVTEETQTVLENVLGKADTNHVVIETQENLLNAAWEKRDVLAIVPFEELQPKWRVISLNEQSPISNQFDLLQYPLKVTFGWVIDEGSQSTRANELAAITLPALTSNYDPEKLTVVVMTGVTALVRATAVRMEKNGVTYPAEKIRDWLLQADITHISNEVSFAENCPDPKSDPYPLVFCSKPAYFDLLTYVGADVIDMTGNHQLDWGKSALKYTLSLYEQNGLAYYAAGWTEDQAKDAVLLENNGNKFAFMGCNPVGPEYIWAIGDNPGVADCDYPYIESRIKELKNQGYQVIFTYQYFETYRHTTEAYEERDFRRIADAGAVIVSGSQAHHPMIMEFYNDSYIHYGLGNLFFDQMWVNTVTIPHGTRKEFIDRYVFYDSRLISTELLTAYLEDYAQPRPMTEEERLDFLKTIFDAAGWGPY